MLTAKSHIGTDKLSQGFSRDAEAELDRQENLVRSAADVARVDGAFLGITYGMVLAWTAVGVGLSGGVVAAGSLVLDLLR